MTEVITTTSGPSSAQTNNAAKKLSGDFDQFLRLLTTQLKNQDPLEPMDSSEFTNQLVMFSQVEQQINTNSSLDKLLALQVASMTGLGLGYIGLDVIHVGDTFETDGQSDVMINYSLDAQAVSSKITISDEDNNTVYSVDGSPEAGSHKFTWDGKDNNGNPVPAGTYKITIAALNESGKPIGTETLVPGRVTGIETSQFGEVLLNVGNELFSLSEIKAARQPGT